MKAGEVTDATIELPSARLVVELPNGQKVAIKDYIHADDERGQPVIVLRAGRKIG